MLVGSPLVFEPVYQERIWGGERLWSVLGREVPFERTGESWEISAHPHGTTRVARGALRGKTLLELMAEERRELLGELCEETFPLLVKVIGAEQDLSVQVHPDDTLAQRTGVRGKTEAWYVLHAEPGARIIYGLKPGVTRETLHTAVQSGHLLSALREVPVQTGDFIPLPAGCVHALGGGILVAEIQQSSDTTYRLYDWGRVDADGKPRSLHVKEGLAAVKPDLALKTDFKNGFADGDVLFDDIHFKVEGVVVDGERTIGPSAAFRLWTVLEGSGRFVGDDSFKIVPGTSLLLPAAMDKTVFTGKFRLLKITPKNTTRP